MNEQTRLIGRMVAIESPISEGEDMNAAFAAASTIRRSGPLNEIDWADNGDHIP